MEWRGAEERVKVEKWLHSGYIHRYDLQREKINTQKTNILKSGLFHS